MAQMRQEPQNNWRLILHELEALGYDEESSALVEDINRGDKGKIEKYLLEERDLVERFFFSYPALTWLMVKVGNEMIFPLLVASWTSLSDALVASLKEVPMKSEYIHYIRNEETARDFSSSFPHLISRTSTFAITTRESGGWLYWYFVIFPSLFYEHITDLLYWSTKSLYPEDVAFVLDKGKNLLSSKDLLNVVKRIIENVQDSYRRWGKYGWQHISASLKEIVNMIVSDPNLQVDETQSTNIEMILSILAKYRFNEAIKIIVSHNKINFDNELLHSADNDLLRFLLADGLFDPREADVLFSTITPKDETPEITKERIKIILEDGRVFESEYENAPTKAQRGAELAAGFGQQDLVEIFLSYEEIDPYGVLHSAVSNNQLELVKWLLTQPRVHPGEYQNGVIVQSIWDKNTAMSRLLLRDPRVSALGNNNRLLHEAIAKKMLAIVKILLKEKKVVPRLSDLFFAIDRGEDKFFPLLMEYAKVDSLDFIDLLKRAIKRYKKKPDAIRNMIPMILNDDRLKNIVSARNEIKAAIGNNSDLQFILSHSKLQ